MLLAPRSQRALGIWLQRCTTAGRPLQRGSGGEAPAQGLLLGRKQVKFVPFWCWCLNVSSRSVHCHGFSALPLAPPGALSAGHSWEKASSSVSQLGLGRPVQDAGRAAVTRAAACRRVAAVLSPLLATPFPPPPPVLPQPKHQSNKLKAVIIFFDTFVSIYAKYLTNWLLSVSPRRQQQLVCMVIDGIRVHFCKKNLAQMFFRVASGEY